MTRTQKLGLCTWLPEDPVCLAEVNDNFNRLDSSGGRAMQLAETALVDLGGVMAAQAHQGSHAAYSHSIMADAFFDAAKIASYSGVLYRGKRLELMSAGLEGGTITAGTNVTAGGGAYNAENVVRYIKVTQSWAKIFDFYPDAYGNLTKFVLNSSSSTSSKTTTFKLAICDTEADEMLWQSGLITVEKGSDGNAPTSFAPSFLLDPNHKYAMMIWIDDMPSSSFSFYSMVFTVTPIIYSSGFVTTKEMAIPAGTQRAVLLVHAGAEAPEASLRFGSGSYTVLTAEEEAADTLPGGESCTLRCYSLAVPTDAQGAQIKLTLPAADCKIYDYALILL